MKTRARSTQNKEYVRILKMISRCADCGAKEELTFDHLPGHQKIDNIATMVHHASLKKLRREIAKCEIVCVTCHRARNEQRGQHNYKIE